MPAVPAWVGPPVPLPRSPARRPVPPGPCELSGAPVLAEPPPATGPLGPRGVPSPPEPRRRAGRTTRALVSAPSAATRRALLRRTAARAAATAVGRGSTSVVWVVSCGPDPGPGLSGGSTRRSPRNPTAGVGLPSSRAPEHCDSATRRASEGSSDASTDGCAARSCSLPPAPPPPNSAAVRSGSRSVSGAATGGRRRCRTPRRTPPDLSEARSPRSPRRMRGPRGGRDRAERPRSREREQGADDGGRVRVGDGDGAPDRDGGRDRVLMQRRYERPPPPDDLAQFPGITRRLWKTPPLISVTRRLRAAPAPCVHRSPLRPR